MSRPEPHSLPAVCENCATPLQGEYCHACGQSVHSPTRDFRHAVEDVFESFWHLDGRVFRTLRDLLVPGRVAINYLAGKRARYLPPLRLFVILSVLTFFVARLVVQVDEGPVDFSVGGQSISQATTVAEVERIRDELLKDISAAEDERTLPGVDAALVAARARIQGAAASRIAQLERGTEAAATGQSPVAEPGSTGQAPAEAGTPDAQPSGPAPVAAPAVAGGRWDAVDIAWLPGFANRWLNRKLARAQANLEHMQGDAGRIVEAFLQTLPTTLFLMMPVFALLLKVFYLGSGRRYLEHLVVALYSHAWLLLVLLAMLLLNALDEVFPTTAVWVLTALASGLVWLLIPIYLFVTQHRVYGEHWVLTAVRYLVIGTVYSVLLAIATLFAVLAGIAS